MSDAQKHQFLRELIHRYGSMVLRRNKAILRDPVLADDGFQQTFLRFTRWLDSQPELPPIESVSGLLLAMAERAAIDLYRRRQREDQVTEGLSTHATVTAGDWLYVDELLDRLLPRERRIVEMSVFGGMSAVEIAGELRLEPGTVRVAKYRAFNKLREFFRGDVTFPGGRGDE